ncbi:MAG: prepilin-type N-terminal cleavage/methylation domain-containing protein, partial [Kiritimatiellae bacterium]|nr:prepilin-type N-terminal cleavage/methylation domain-containing protein [Kiritimatiellia bacterium]
MILNKRGFTLVELMVVVAMIAIFMAAVGTAVGKTRERARIEKARSDVKVISQAILAWENYSRGGATELREINDEEADTSSLSFLFGKGESAESGDIP